jgi:hypothetical protein
VPLPPVALLETTTQKDEVPEVKKVLVVGVAGLAALGVAACGSSEDAIVSADVSKTFDQAARTAEQVKVAPSHEKFVAQINKWCHDGNTDPEYLKLRDEYRAVTDWARAAELMERFADLSAEQQDELEAVVPAPEDEEAFARYVDSQADRIGLSRRRAALLRSPDPGSENYQVLNSLDEKVDMQRIESAIDMGANKCGQVS